MKKIRFCIVVVEDNKFYQQLIAKQLESITNNIHFYTNGEDCLTNLANSKADVIVLDNNLEGVMTGLETLKEIRRVDDNIHVIIFSTETGLDTPENFSIFGSFEYIEKNSSGFRKLREKIVSSEAYANSGNLID